MVQDHVRNAVTEASYYQCLSRARLQAMYVHKGCYDLSDEVFLSYKLYVKPKIATIFTVKIKLIIFALFETTMKCRYLDDPHRIWC